MAATTPPAAPIFVFTYTIDMAVASAAEPKASCDPPLKPNQPNQRTKVPSVAKGMFAPGIGLIFPSAVYLPLRAPKIIAPVSAHQPPTE